MDRMKKFGTAAVLAALISLVVIEFAAHRRIPFMMDDLWYGTNLVTGEPLRGLKDIVESMTWHFYNWGGRCMTHGILQLTLMSGELWADILNVFMTLLLTFLVCVIIGRKNLQSFLLVHSLLFALNANVKMSMLWQAGTANYVYSSVWILIFLWPYLRALKEPDSSSLPLAGLWLLPIGLLAGWSNENMGPACFVTAVGIMVYLKIFLKKRPARWMFAGASTSLIGSILVVAAPGNFVRSEFVQAQSFFDRFYSMLTAGTDFLLPSVLPMTVLLLIRGICLGKGLSKEQWGMLAVAVLSYGAMVLSPHYPDRATFGTMVMCIAVSASALWDIIKERPRLTHWAGALTVCFWLGAVGRLLLEISYM